jgi:hypothetical protein
MWTFVQNLRRKIYSKSFQPKWSFVKSIPGLFVDAGDATQAVDALQRGHRLRQDDAQITLAGKRS